MEKTSNEEGVSTTSSFSIAAVPQYSKFQRIIGIPEHEALTATLLELENQVAFSIFQKWSIHQSILE
jgi:hypothetical protein